MAQNDSKKYIQSVSAFNCEKTRKANTPTQYSDRRTQYMAGRASMFDSNRAYLSTDYVEAEVQGLTENFYEWVETYIRLADISSKTATATKKSDDYKEVLLPDFDYLPIGAKIRTMGSTWISINPSNLSTAKTTAIVARCNASYNSYDYYGNVIVEPIIVEKYAMASNDNNRKNNLVLMDGYFNITCQLNGNTEQLKENSRIILGKKPYQITGVTDFIQEFSGDRSSCKLLTFTARVEEPTESDDLTDKFIAGGKEYFFDCIMQAVDNMAVGENLLFTPHFVKGYDLVEGTEQYPITWIWDSSDKNIATVNENGVVTAISSGTVQISAKMAQNPLICVSVDLVVDEVKKDEKKVVFVNPIPQSISQYETITITAVYRENGVMTDQPIEWFFEGADSEDDYTAVISKDGKSVEITCNSASDNCLEVSASCNGVSALAIIELLGY